MLALDPELRYSYDTIRIPLASDSALLAVVHGSFKVYMMINYLGLLGIILLAISLAYVLAQDMRGLPNRLYAWYAGNALLLNCCSLISLTITSESWAYLTVRAMEPLLATSNLFLVWLVCVLFFPQRYAQPLVRWLIGVPYLVVALVALLDVITAGHLGFVGLQPTSDHTYLLSPPKEPMPFLIALIGMQYIMLVPITIIAIWSPDRRRPAIVLWIGMVISLIAPGLVRSDNLAVAFNLGPLPLYVAFAWVTLRYNLFRPSLITLQTAIEHMPDGIVVLDRAQRVRYVNAAAQTLLAPPPSVVAQPLADVLAQSSWQIAQRAHDAVGEHTRLVRVKPPQVLEGIEVAVRGDRDASRILVLRDITDREQQAAALRTQNDEQQRLLDLVATLEAPIVALTEEILFVPLIGNLDSRRAQTLTTQLLHEAHERHTRLVVLDVTGVPVVDSRVARALIQTTRSLRLLGCQVMLSGISAAIAISLVEQEISLEDVMTVRTLQEALDAHTLLAQGASQRSKKMWHGAVE